MGVDTQTGTNFIDTGLNLDMVVNVPTGGVSETFVNRFRLQATGGEQSFIVSETLHLTVNANGDLTVFFDNFSATC
jgi:hypothetical protein